ncbi:MAG: histidine--tRNA ligase [Oligoflexia bacterium]|nr:histidine--tRNA ligase [Oligoflexia bacterium]
MTLSKKPYRGTRDFFPKDKRVQDYMFSKMSEAANLYGYEPYDGPLLEEVELYKAKSGEELINDQIYSFNDRGERFVAIRPEMTPTVARMVAQIHKEQAKPIRWFSIPNLMRYEKPQRGRLREHWQFNCDVFGAPGRFGEIEILQVAAQLLESFGANEKNFEILINDREIVDHIFSNLIKADQEQTYRLYKIVDKSKKVDEAAINKMVDEVGLSADGKDAFLKYLTLTSFEDLKAFVSTSDANLDSFDEFITLLNNSSVSKYIKYDPTIVRGLDYYTGVVFEIFDKHPDNRRAICGGGAYANLLQIFNEKPLPGVGFGLGDVTLRDFLETHNLLPDLEKDNFDIFVTFQDEGARDASLSIADQLRKQGIKAVTQFEKVKFNKVFKQAEKKSVRFVSFLGDQELEKKTILIKNLESKEQKEFNHSDIEAIRDYIRS